ncbi:CFAP69 [Symbiodinium pilosum]|uniref:CFAP69 protein n=1 Tax=Symbiodinium pilosum TaxID=2952 RepID=A0A812ITK5_SYMPI|nr:CFAP69 [Symbiodinium pilosum]
MELMTSKYTIDLVDRHVAAIRKLCKVCCNGFLLKHLEALVDLLHLAVERFAQGQDLAQALCDFTRVASQPFVSCKTSDMITYGHHLPAFIKGLVSVLSYTLPPTATAGLEQRKAMFERLRIEVAHTLACWARFGLDEDSVELLPNQPLIQAVADSGTPNLRILRQSNVMDAVSASFRSEDSPESIVITLGAIRDMSLYRPLACQITNCGLISNLVHVIRVNLLGSDVLLVAAEVLWNVLELDWDGATEALGQEEVIESFRDFMNAVLTRGYRFKDKIFRNDMMVLLMYISKRVENRTLFASTGLMALLLSYAVSEARRKELLQSGVLERCLQEVRVLPDLGDGAKASKGIPLTNTQEDMEFRTLLWGTLARCCSSEPCAEAAVQFGFVESLLDCLDAEAPPEKWSQEQRRQVQLEALSSLFQLVQYVPDAFMEAQGNAMVLQLLQATRSREVQKKCLHLLQVAVRMGPHFAENLGQLGAVGTLVELFTDKDNPMTSRQMCASVLATMCKEYPENAREFRKKDGVEAMRDEVVYRPGETTDNHLFYSLCVVDCVWNSVVGTRKNEIRFLDAGGLFALLDCLEVAPMILKRQIIGCLADLMEYKKASEKRGKEVKGFESNCCEAAKLFTQWNSQVTMKGALRLLLELWQCEQQAAGNLSPDGVIRDLEQPLNPRAPPTLALGELIDDGDSTVTSTSRLAGKFRHAKNFADTAGTGNTNAGTTNGTTATVTSLSRTRRAKIYAVLKCIGFECQETLSIAERQQMELVKLYPMAVELEMWIKVQESLAIRGIKPVSADRQWIEDCVTERKDQAAWVQNIQKKLAEERQREEEASLERFYKDLRGRAQIQRMPQPPGARDTLPLSFSQF